MRLSSLVLASSSPDSATASSSTTSRGRALTWLAIATAWVAGTVLRVWNLRVQVLAGDELYTVEAALDTPLWELLTTYQLKDHCLPLSGLCRILLEAGVPPTELLFRVPILLCGLAVLVLVPLWARRRLGTAVAAALAWLVATSPALVLYSRIVRPYMPVVLLSFVAVVAFESWWRRPRWQLALAYAGAAAVSAYFHLGSVPFVCAPLLFGTLAKLWDRRRGPSFPALLVVGTFTAGAFAAVVLLTWPSLAELVAAKRNPLEIRALTITGTARLQAGTAIPVLAAVFWLLAAAGLVRSWRRDRELSSYLIVPVVGQVVGLLVLSPEMLVHPMMFNRYLIPTLPWVLLWVAVALMDPFPTVFRRFRAVAAAAVVAFLFAGGPLARGDFWRSSFAHHNDFVAFFCPPARLSPQSVPRFYTEVLAAAEEAPVLELPWHRWWTYMRAGYLYQLEHGQDVLISLDRPLAGEPRLDFHNMVFGTAPEILKSRARYVVVHTDLPVEEKQVEGHCWQILDRLKPHHAQRLRRRGRFVAHRLSELWGSPHFSEGSLRIWDLDRVAPGRVERGRVAPAPADPSVAGSENVMSMERRTFDPLTTDR